MLSISREPEPRRGSGEASDAQLVHPPGNCPWVPICASSVATFGVFSVQPVSLRGAAQLLSWPGGWGFLLVPLPAQ